VGTLLEGAGDLAAGERLALDLAIERFTYELSFQTTACDREPPPDLSWRQNFCLGLRVYAR